MDKTTKLLLILILAIAVLAAFQLAHSVDEGQRLVGPSVAEGADTASPPRS